ncbi:MAG: galactose-1-phosphate uridylyltransferase [Microcystaceae cyanobacterium]
MASSQIRLNMVTGEWVIYAPRRGKRPHDLDQSLVKSDNPAQNEQDCPFCQHNQQVLSKTLIEEIPDKTGESWQIRVIENGYPALTPHKDTERISCGFYLKTAAYGRQEVIIESPNHYATLDTLPVSEVEQVIEAYHRRYLKLMEDPLIKMVIIFRNQGKKAGASLRHPHSQLIASSVVPRNRRWQDEEAQRYFDCWDRCLYCDILGAELQAKERLVAENDSFVAFVPYAAEVSYEVWIVPKRHQADFGDIQPEEKKAFAAILRHILRRIAKKLGNPDYNYVINSAVRYKSEEPQLHWYCQIIPRIGTPAGFELGSRMSINPSLPEENAEFLRSDAD